jgi:4-hydroxy-tetrahydrodipicolinate synthase
MEHYRALAQHPNVAGVKEASGDLSLLENLCASCGEDLDVYTGNDDQLVAAMKLGAQGGISVCSNLLPRETVDLYRLCINGNLRAAERMREELLPKIKALFREVNPIPLKAALAMMGKCGGYLRQPLTGISPGPLEQLRKTLFCMNLI